MRGHLGYQRGCAVLVDPGSSPRQTELRWERSGQEGTLTGVGCWDPTQAGIDRRVSVSEGPQEEPSNVSWVWAEQCGSFL